MTTVTTIMMPDERALRLFPEAAALAVLEAALAAAELALRDEHPTLEYTLIDPEHDSSALPLTASLILSRTVELRRLVRFYSRGVTRTIRSYSDDDPSDLIP